MDVLGSTDRVESKDDVMERPFTFLFVDLAGFTALTEAHGDSDAADVAERFFTLTRSRLVGGARLVKTLGDGVMVVAPDARDAVATALSLCADVHQEPSFPMARAGLHTGDAVERSDDFFGAAVNLAARVAAHARAGEILCTRAVASVVEHEGLASVAPIGAVRLKNIVQPVDLFALAALAGAPVVDPVCRMCMTPDKVKAQIAFEGTTVCFCSELCAERFRASPRDYPPRSGGPR